MAIYLALYYLLLLITYNMLFISYGLMNAKSLGIIPRFWIGRFIEYLLMISLSKYLVNYFKEILNSDIQSILIIDIIGIIMTLFMLLIIGIFYFLRYISFY